MQLRRLALLFPLLFIAVDLHAATRRALLIGIDDYTASHFSARPPMDRDWPSLGGPVRDIGLLSEALVLLYGFEERNIVRLTDQHATRAGILQAIEQLARSAGKEDVIFFYFAGHGSQVVNTLSEEPDKLDESIVPADSRAGALDIRDKELRRLFNRILDRGAQLTVMLDNCRSGSGARGITTNAVSRSVRPDRRDVHDGSNAGPRPEERGALVLSASRDYANAYEVRVNGMRHGAFTWAWMQALREGVPNESVTETFLRVQARMRASSPIQEPSMSGNDASRKRPFLGARVERAHARNIVGVERVLGDGTVVLQGGWANGLAVGAQLRTVKGPPAPLIVTDLLGIGRAEARLAHYGAMPSSVGRGALMEIVGWATPPGRPLRVFAPPGTDAEALAAEAGRAFDRTRARHIRWSEDPTENAPLVRNLGDLDDVPAGASLFVRLPAPRGLIDAIGIDQAESAEEADYILVGRFVRKKLEWAWIRPFAQAGDRCALPARSDWTDSPAVLADALHRLRRLHAWQQLESPPDSDSPYRLALLDDRGGEVRDFAVGARSYSLVLRASSVPADLKPRFFYVFVVDSRGKSYLVYPAGAMENRFPIGQPSNEISLGRDGLLAMLPPYGFDTYFLLTTEEPLPNPWILEWDGVRTRSPASPTALERLLMLDDVESRGPHVTPVGWSLERMTLESVPPSVKRPRKKRH